MIVRLLSAIATSINPDYPELTRVNNLLTKEDRSVLKDLKKIRAATLIQFTVKTNRIGDFKKVSEILDKLERLNLIEKEFHRNEVSDKIFLIYSISSKGDLVGLML